MAIVVSILGSSRILSEGSNLIQIDLLTSEPVPMGELILVDFEVLPGSATPKQDYELQSTSAVFIRQTGVYADRVSIPSGASIGSILINLVQDEVIEGDEDFLVKITGVSPNIQIGENSSVSVTISDDDSKVIYRLNAGGGEIESTDGGPNWLPDEAFLLNPEQTSIFKALMPVTLDDTVPNSTPVEIFQTERFDRIVCSSGDTEMQYAFAVDPGIYEVQLYVANTFDATSLPGQRIFDITIENETFPNLSNIDLSSKFGHLVGGLLTTEVEVVDGILNIAFLHDLLNGIENPLINGIQVIQVGNIDDLPTVSVIGEPYIVSENTHLTSITLVTSEPVQSDRNLTVTFQIVPDLARPLEDYKYESPTAKLDPKTGIYTDSVTLPSGSSIAGIPINIIGNAVVEGPESFSFKIIEVDSYFQIGGDGSTTITIIENDYGSSELLSFQGEYATENFENDSTDLEGQMLGLGGGTLDGLVGVVPGTGNPSDGTLEIMTEDLLLQNPLAIAIADLDGFADQVVFEESQSGIGDVSKLTPAEEYSQPFLMDSTQSDYAVPTAFGW